MSWRDESVFKQQSQLSDAEKDFLKFSKKLREIMKLEEKVAAGEQLAENQRLKMDDKENVVKDIIKCAKLMPAKSDLWPKFQDVATLLPKEEADRILKFRDQKENSEKRQEAVKEQKFQERHERRREDVEPQTQHSRAITAVVYDQHAGMVYTSSKDKLVLEWKIDLPQLIATRTLAGHDGCVWCLDLCEEGIISGGADGNVCIFPRQGKIVTRAGKTQAIGGVVKSLSVNKDEADTNGYIAVAGDKVGNTKAYITVLKPDLTEVWRNTEFPSKCTGLVWGVAGGSPVISAHEDGRLAVWNAMTGARLTVVHLHDGPIWSVTRCGNCLTSASQDKTAKVVDLSTKDFTTLQKVTANRPLRTCTYDGKGTITYAGGREPRDVTTSSLLDDEFEIFTCWEGKVWKTQSAHFGPVHQVLFETKEQGEIDTFFSVSEDGTFRFWATDGSLLAKDTK